MKRVKRHQWRRSGIFMVKDEHISYFVLIPGFQQANLCWVHIENFHIENTNTFEGENRYIRKYAAMFSM